MAINRKTEIDIIILSYAQNEKLKQITLDGIYSIVDSEDPAEIKFNILVIESEKGLSGYQYPHSQTIYPEKPFGYHRYMNIGIELTSAPYVCLCNNDLIFQKGWASEILKYMHEYPDLISASPYSRSSHEFTFLSMNSGIKFGYLIGYEIAGWCLFTRRTLFNKIGKLDENYEFMGADNDYANTLAMLRLKHALVTSSIVDHMHSETLHAQSKEQQDKLNLANDLDPYHMKKWYHRLLPFKVV